MSRWPWPRKLAGRISLAISAVILTGIVVIAGGIALYGIYDVGRQPELISPGARRAIAAFERGEVPAPADVEAFAQSTRSVMNVSSRGENLLLAGLSVFALLLGAAVGAALAGSIAAPISRVAGAAGKIASGDFKLLLAEEPGAPAEIASLIASFNSLAAALEKADADVRFNAAAIAHELRTPLTVLQGYVQGAIDGVFVADTAHLERLMRQIEGLGRLVDDLRTLTLASSGALVVDRQSADLADIAQAVIDGLRPSLTADGFRIELSLAPAPLRADADRVAQALTALIENVRRHAAAGAWLRIETAHSPASGQAVMRVLDRGPGVERSDNARPFERFWRADTSRSRSGGGSGLGLSIVQAIVQAHGGRAALKSGPDSGLCAELTFPAT